MPSLKSMGAACAVGASLLMGCATYSADLQNPARKAPTLQSHEWVLQKALTPQGSVDAQWQVALNDQQPARHVELHFSKDQRVNVSRLCNSMNGGYSIQGDKIHIAQVVSTMMACSDNALMQLERSVAQQLPKATTWAISDSPQPVLELKFENGATWVLQGTPTYETLYGPGERVFLEVASKKVACNQPLVPNGQCLKVREVSYNDQGIKQSHRPWSNYYGTIDGYVHQDGVRNILRINRFKNSQAPADSSKYVDVLDLVVESEIQP